MKKLLEKKKEKKFRLYSLLSDISKPFFQTEQERLVFQDLLSVSFNRIFLYTSEIKKALISNKNFTDDKPSISCFFLFGSSSPLFNPVASGNVILPFFQKLEKTYRYNLQMSYIFLHKERLVDMLSPFEEPKSLHVVKKQYVDKQNFRRLIKQAHQELVLPDKEKQRDGIKILTFYYGKSKVHFVRFFDVFKMTDYQQSSGFQNSFNLSGVSKSMDMLVNQIENNISSVNGKTFENLVSVLRCIREKKIVPSFRESKVTQFLKDGLKNSTFIVHFNSKTEEKSYRLLKFSSVLADLNKKLQNYDFLKQTIIQLKEDVSRLEKENSNLSAMYKRTTEKNELYSRELDKAMRRIKKLENSKSQLERKQRKLTDSLKKIKSNTVPLSSVRRLISGLETNNRHVRSVMQDSEIDGLNLKQIQSLL